MRKKYFWQKFRLRRGIICWHSVDIHIRCWFCTCFMFFYRLLFVLLFHAYYRIYIHSLLYTCINTLHFSLSFLDSLLLIPWKWNVCIPEAHTEWGFSVCDTEGGRRGETDTDRVTEWLSERDRESYKMMMSNCQLFTTFTKPISNWFGSWKIRLKEGFSTLFFIFFLENVVAKASFLSHTHNFVVQSNSLMSKKREKASIISFAVECHNGC